jgi:hypothetical protein
MNYSDAELAAMIKAPKEGLNGVKLLRAMIAWLDDRPEWLNENKTPEKLITEFKASIEPF